MAYFSLSTEKMQEDWLVTITLSGGKEERLIRKSPSEGKGGDGQEDSWVHETHNLVVKFSFENVKGGQT